MRQLVAFVGELLLDVTAVRERDRQEQGSDDAEPACLSNAKTRLPRMHEPHPVFNPPTNPDVSIWRYMDLAKFLDMLEAEALYFSCTDRMDDEFEGSISRPTHDAILGGLQGQLYWVVNDTWAFKRKTLRDHTYLSCWHMNEHESAAMWAIYQSGEASIAVRSTYVRLTKSITDSRDVYIGKVSYIDFDSDKIPDNDLYHPYVYKRKSFEHEREIRAIHCSPEFGTHKTKWSEFDWSVGEPGVHITVNLDDLVEKVYVSPKAPKWFAELIRSLLKRYRRTWEVKHSDLDSDPIY